MVNDKIRDLNFPLSAGYRLYSRKQNRRIVHTITKWDEYVGNFFAEKWDCCMQNNVINLRRLEA